MLSRVGRRAHTVERIGTLTDFRALEPAWQHLLLGDSSHTIFQTYHWLVSWWDVFGADRDLFILTTGTRDQVTAIAPLMRRSMMRSGRTHRVIEFIGTPNIDYADIIAEDKEAAWIAVLDYLDSHRQEWDSIDLSQVNDRSPSCAILDNLLCEPRWLCHKSTQETCLAFEFVGSDAERATFQSGGKTRLRKAIKAMDKLGGLRFQRIPARELAHHLPSLFQLHVTRWMNSSTPSKFLKPEHRRFYNLLADRLGPAGQIAFTSLTAGDLPVCYCFGFDYRGVIHHSTITHNSYFAKWSPGNLLLNCQAEQFIRDGRTLDYSRGVQSYKKLLANRLSTNYRFEIFADRAALSRARLIAAIRRYPIVRKLLDHPKVIALRTRLTALRSRAGTAGLLRRLIRRGLQLVWDSRTFNVLEFSGEINRSITPAIDVAMRQLTEQDLPAICSLYGVEAGSPKFQTFQQRFRSGADCWGGFHDGRLISIGWCIYTQDVDSSSGFALTAGPGEVILADGLSSELYRGMRVRPYLINLEIERYQAQGLKVITAVDQANTPSMHNVARIGFTRIRQARVVRLFGVRVV